MSGDHRYNGWANYETWAMALWIDNDQGSYEYSRELIAEADEAARLGQSEGTPARSAIGYAADALKEAFGDLPEDVESAVSGTVFGDLLGAALSEVDWYEIAENYLSEFDS